MKKTKVVSKAVPLGQPWYMLPPFLEGVISLKDYRDWLQKKGHTIRQRDRKLKRPFAKANTDTVYKQKIHQAVCNGGQFDPFTGDKINWGLILKEKTLKKDDCINDYLNTYGLAPVVDHINPEEFGFEICTWISNESKSCMTSDQFVDFCRKVVRFRDRAEKGRR